MKARRKPQPIVRTRHDEWTKRAFALWLAALGDVELDVRIAGESRKRRAAVTRSKMLPCVCW